MASRGIRYTNDHQHNREPVVAHPLRRENSVDYVIDQPRSTLPTSYSREDESAQGRRNSDNDAGFSSAPSPQMPPASALPAKNRLDPAVTSSSPSQALIVMDAKKLGHAPIVGRRKSGGSGGEQMALRSPVVKRPVAAPVALQGWLHKQGSEGLMLWKKRWFVLSEYCLFYYKSSEEEKLLGSILLPSYKISPCSPEDRVYRKFAFKAEHVNMRTYYFAADSRELMVQWMNALSLASILQEGINWEQHRNGRPSVSSISSMLNQSNDDSDSGFHGYRTRTGILPTKSKSEEGQLNSSHDSTISNGWGVQRPAGFQQPLYANAPPKPRRLTDREGMSSPEPTPEKRLDGSKTPDLDSCKVYPPRNAQPQQPVAIRNDRGGIDLRYHYQAVGQTPQWIQQPQPTQAPSVQVIVPNAERRTPDTYGRSNSTTPGPIKMKGSDYEDVYNNSEARQSGGQMYRRPSGQVAYLKGAGPPIPFPQNYPVEIVPSGQYGQSYYRYPNQGQPTSVQNIVYSTTPTHQSVQTNRQRSRPHPPRPHSADFLEYDARRYYQEQVYYQSNVISRDQSTNNIGIEEKMCVDKNNKARLPRPKSSLDVIGPSGMGVGDYYWSEESYAQKMRQSASYLHHTPTRVQQSSRATTPSVRLVTPVGVSAVDGGPVGGTSSGGSVASEVFRTPKRTEVDVNEWVKMRSASQQQQHQEQQRRWSEYADGNFMRSASARLPRSRYDDENADSPDEDQRQKSTSDVREGEKKIQQREESMKRLLEWKQRMLQSPLSRKPSGSSNRGTAQNELSKYYKQQVLRELANHDARSRDDGRGPRRRSSHQEDGRVNLRSRSQDGRRSSTPLNRYNSYSSDDEELGEDLRKSRKRVRRPSQAGRSSRRHPQNGATPDYENVSLVKPKTNPNIIQRDVKDPRESKCAVREEIPPDAAYDVEYHIPKEFRNQSQQDESASQCSFENSKSHNRVNRSRDYKDLNILPSDVKSDRNYRSSLKNHKSENNLKGEGLPSLKKLGNTTCSSAIPDDAYSNGKHSDSGYDTLQIGRAVNQDLQKFPRSGLDSWKRTELVYPLQEVQWNTDGINLNESRFAKEISYQYVTSGKDTNVPRKKAESTPKNIVQNRIKAFEDEGVVRVATNVTIKMQEPLKVSPPMYQPFEAHVSNLRSSELSPDDLNKTRPQNVKSFALGDSRSSPEDNYSENDGTKCNVENIVKEADKHTKSVKDLLADFERKSQLVKERQAAEEERSSEGGPGKRFVFSDTETLLYDTSSDGDGHEDKKRSLPIHIRQRSESRIGPGFSDDDDKDEEVAAALGKTDKFFSSCRDLGRNRDLYFYGDRRRKRKTSRGSDVSAANNLEAIVTPGYLRLSMAESLGTHEDEESLCCTPTERQIDVDIVIKDANETVVGSEKPSDQEVIEEYYMPMTPSRKAVLAPPDAFKNHSAIMENIFGGCLDFEESSYVEMSENRHGRSLLAPNSSCFTSKFDLKRLNSSDSNATYATPDSPRYCEIGKGEASHYEFLCKASTQYEPVYMEVSPLMDILKDREDAKKSSRDNEEVKDNSDSTLRSGSSAERLREEALDVLPPTPPRLSLPDICSSPNTSTRKTPDRDSSDADDEASKDLDSLDAPRHPRFSLSDTFRPASYYLGASSAVISGLGIATEHQDSSDSDLVSPPPIPTSPPPLDDFETSLELQDSSLEIKKSPSLEKTSDDDVRRIWSKTPLPKSPSDSEAVELRHSDSEERMLKRRPVSDDLIDSLEDSRYLLSLSFVGRRSGSDLDSIGSRSGLAMDLDDGVSIDLDKYLEDLQSRDAFNVDLYSKEHNYGYYRSYQDMYGLNENFPANTDQEARKIRTEKSIIPDGHRSSLPQLQNLNSLPFNLDISNQNITLPPPNEEEVHYENLQMILPPPPEHASEPSDQDISSERSSIGSHRRTDLEMIRANVSKEAEEEQAAGAPYYYSDLLKSEEDGGLLSSNSEKSLNSFRGFPGYPMVNSVNRNGVSVRAYALNNQRGDSEGNFMYKRNDVGRKVNPINPEIFPPPYVPSSEEEGRLLAQELRTSTVHFLDAADKRGQVDVRNLYESDTLQRRKPTNQVEQHMHSDQSQDSSTHPTNTVNLYPHGIRDKSSPSTSHDSPSEFHGNHQRRSRSLEGLLDDPEFLSYNAQRAPPLSTSFTTSLINVPQSVTSGRSPSVPLQPPMQVPPPHTQRAEGQTPSTVPHETVPCEGDDLWEEDTLWRDSLRRVSLRHTRSLDNLDGGRARSHSRLSNTSVVTSSTLEQSSGRRSVDVVSGRKINREVTYVNDSMVRGQMPSVGREYEEDYREGRKRMRRRPSGEGEDLRDDGVHYERLSRFSESLERTRRGQTYIEGYVWDEDRETFRKGLSAARDEEKKGNESPQTFLEDASLPPPAPSFEIDREKLRQWDLMSSAPLRQGVAPGVASPGEGGRLDQAQPHKGATDGEDPRPPSSTASGSGSVIGRDPLPPRSISTAEIAQPGKKSPPTITVTAEEKAQSPGDHRNHVITHPPDNHRNHQSPGDPRGQQNDLRNNVITKPPDNHRNHVIIQPLGDPRGQQNDLRNHVITKPPDNRRNHVIIQPLGDHRTHLVSKSPVDHRNMIVQSPDRRNYGVAQSPADLRSQVITQEPSDYRNQADYSNYALSQDSGSHGRLQTSGDYRNHTITHGMGDRSHSVSSPGLSSPNQYSQTFGDRDSNMSERGDTLERKEKKPQAGNPWSLTVSAGELLGRTHEELVLLLIQLRRQSAGVCKAMETCHIEIEAQARLAELETPQRLEHLQRLEDLKRHLLELEKQYEKGKPLVNLVDNMVKLGSLYRGTGTHLQPAGIIEVPTVRERLEFNQKVQEQRLLAEERKDWNRLSPDRGQLQAKVQELYRLDRLLQEESGTLQSLQQDKELLEKALGGLRHKLQGGRSNPAEAERYRKQQRLLERELSRVRMLLAHNSKKLEETVAENARLEQELVVIRQKLQASRRGSLQHPALHRSAEQAGANTAALEAELRRVQQLVGDLQRQRQELSIQVRQLTEKSHNLVQQIRPGPTGVSGAGAIPGRKRHHTTWLETDLDSLVTLDHGLDSPASPQHPPPSPGVKTSPPDPQATTPLYMNTDLRRDPSEYEAPDEDVPPPLPVPPELPPDYPPPPPPPPSEEALLNGTGQYQLDISEADDRMKRFYGIIPREKPQEIKTVRIVKRESERRQKERDRSGNIGIPITNGNSPPKRLPIPEDPQLLEKQPLDRVLEEDQMLGYEDDPVLMQFQRSMSLPRGFGSRGRLTYQQPPPPPVRDPALRGDSHTALRNLMIARHRVRFESGSGGSSSGDSIISQRTASPSSSRGLTAHEQLFGVNYNSDSPQLSPVFKSEAARAIVMEMATMRDDDLPQKRVVPKEKRRHHTVSSGRPLYDVDSTLSIMGSARSRDDLDMERALRPRLNAPDVVRSTMSHKDFKYNENTIDNILGTPNKILIPERYIPEQVPEMSAEEQEQRLRKAESIRKMLSETSTSASEVNDPAMEDEQTSTLKKKVQAEKRQREHLLQLNQILAKQVMEKSKMVAGSTCMSAQD